jgi:hypothetical protein
MVETILIVGKKLATSVIKERPKGVVTKKSNDVIVNKLDLVIKPMQDAQVASATILVTIGKAYQHAKKV